MGGWLRLVRPQTVLVLPARELAAIWPVLAPLLALQLPARV